MGRYAAIEAGGTKFVCAVGSNPDDASEPVRIPTETPDVTIPAVVEWVKGVLPVDGIGVASFGPVELRRDHPKYGFITTTPKTAWVDTDLLGPLRPFGVPIGFDTDVNGAALAEGRWGAAAGLDTFTYATIGTGIGVGAVIGGHPAHGLVHSEMGHVIVRRHPDDDFPGRCPYHGDCWEGMASGPAIEDRFGTRAENLDDAEMARAVDLVAWYTADGIRNVVYTIAPQRFVIGGGVSRLPGLFPAIRGALAETLAGYPGLEEHSRDDFVVPTGLHGVAGLYGGLVLAERAVAAGVTR